MITFKGKYNEAIVYSDHVEESAQSQIINLLNQEFISGSKIRIMSDVHAGKGCVIGFTSTLTDKVVPNLVGVDLSCGMYVVKLKDKDIDFEKLDQFIRNNIPHGGGSIRTYRHKFVKDIPLNKLKCISKINIDYAKLSVGSLGGGK